MFADPISVYGDPEGLFAACALADWPASAAGPGGFEKSRASDGAVASPAAVVAVWTVKSMCESDGVVEFHDQRLHQADVPDGQLLT